MLHAGMRFTSRGNSIHRLCKCHELPWRHHLPRLHFAVEERGIFSAGAQALRFTNEIVSLCVELLSLVNKLATPRKYLPRPSREI